MFDDKGRIQTGTPAHRLQVLVTAAGAIVRPHAGDVLDVCGECESRGNADERTSALFEEASAKIEQADGRPGVAYAAKTDEIKHLLARTAAAPGSIVEPETPKPGTPPKGKGKKSKKGEAGGDEGQTSGDGGSGDGE